MVRGKPISVNHAFLFVLCSAAHDLTTLSSRAVEACNTGRKKIKLFFEGGGDVPGINMPRISFKINFSIFLA